MGKWMTLRVQVAILLLMIQRMMYLQYLQKMMDCILRHVDMDLLFIYHVFSNLVNKKDEIVVLAISFLCHVLIAFVEICEAIIHFLHGVG